MVGPTTAHQELDKPPRLRARSTVTFVVMALVALGAIWAATRLVAQPARVARITFENPTVYDLDIEARGRGGDGGVAVGTAARDSATTVRDVLDQGSRWVFSFAAQGQDGGELVVDRAELEDNDWRVAIPATVAETLGSKGASPPP